MNEPTNLGEAVLLTFSFEFLFEVATLCDSGGTLLLVVVMFLALLPRHRVHLFLQSLVLPKKSLVSSFQRGQFTLLLVVVRLQCAW